jgi:hypothetical protein
VGSKRCADHAAGIRCWVDVESRPGRAGDPGTDVVAAAVFALRSSSAPLRGHRRKRTYSRPQAVIRTACFLFQCLVSLGLSHREYFFIMACAHSGSSCSTFLKIARRLTPLAELPTANPEALRMRATNSAVTTGTACRRTRLPTMPCLLSNRERVIRAKRRQNRDLMPKIDIPVARPAATT